MKVVTIPETHINAIRSQEAYFELHRRYAWAYDLSDKEAYLKLESDLEFYGLPGRYSSERSFYSNRAAFSHQLIRVSTR